MKCPNCNEPLAAEVAAHVEYNPYFTTDCGRCGSLLLVRNGTAVLFHKTIHAECEAWPEDGKGTHSLKIGD